MTDQDKAVSDCYCVCHTSISSFAWCEHCQGDNAVGRAARKRDTSDSASDIDRLLELIGDARVKLWFCPNEHPREPLRTTVTWDGDIATCTDCGMTNLTDPRMS